MKTKLQIQTKRNGNINETDYIAIYVGSTRYKFSINNEQKLVVNKMSDIGDDTLNIHPSTSFCI